ncbi:helix-turn-helix domain-containing protein [Caulobacter sp. SLTY]|uniref:helix-turn-helix domain-containing protein n=1 Tax=Caulobacter sp. SLTY TaxID=2683262 RepID=UPI001412FF60|nr:helix-turn-helix domain-containing protein [Caulobacter sp. SLTY]NBB15153.1 helix-turn-helix domain-containing protein [Caulobacter sp. SLTY]
MTKLKPQPIAYRIRDAADVIGLSRSTLYHLAKQGKLRIRKVAGRSLIAREDLLSLLQS